MSAWTREVRSPLLARIPLRTTPPDATERVRLLVESALERGILRGPAEFADVLAMLGVTPRTSPGVPSPGPRREREYLAAIRAWAPGAGHPLAERGRIPAAVVAAYEAAHPSP